MFAEMDRNRDGGVTAFELAKWATDHPEYMEARTSSEDNLETMFDQMDTNQDGSVTLRETGLESADGTAPSSRERKEKDEAKAPTNCVGLPASIR